MNIKYQGNSTTPILQEVERMAVSLVIQLNKSVRKAARFYRKKVFQLKVFFAKFFSYFKQNRLEVLENNKTSSGRIPLNGKRIKPQMIKDILEDRILDYAQIQRQETQQSQLLTSQYQKRFVLFNDNNFQSSQKQQHIRRQLAKKEQNFQMISELRLQQNTFFRQKLVECLLGWYQIYKKMQQISNQKMYIIQMNKNRWSSGRRILAFAIIRSIRQLKCFFAIKATSDF
ncbi:hypothetical protein ABPG74_020983 [Tetrahymena malaccensis]